MKRRVAVAPGAPSITRGESMESSRGDGGGGGGGGGGSASTVWPPTSDSAWLPRPSAAAGRVVPLATAPESTMAPPFSASASAGTLIPSGSASPDCTV